MGELRLGPLTIEALDPSGVCDACGVTGTVAVTVVHPSPETIRRYCESCWPAGLTVSPNGLRRGVHDCYCDGARDAASVTYAAWIERLYCERTETNLTHSAHSCVAFSCRTT